MVHDNGNKFIIKADLEFASSNTVHEKLPYYN
jgi:hypothetical protein